LKSENKKTDQPCYVFPTGFKDALVGTIASKYVIIPSSTALFTSEMPSHFSTPMGTGANTPLPHSSITPMAGGNRDLLVTAVHNVANAAAAAAASANAAPPVASATPHHSTHYAQYPSGIKMTKIPEYFPEWKDAGFEECSFLGAQVAAKVLFVVDQGVTKGFLTRVEYNELGPQAIHTI